LKNSLKGALLSGLIFPGLGQMVLKRYRRGVVLMLAVIAALTVMIMTAVQQAYAVLENIEASGVTPDSDSIRQAAEQAAAASDSRIIPAMALVIMVCWVGGIIDAYLIGRQQDRAARAG
jgi:TM2 domain-containing membrane protein YozV